MLDRERREEGRKEEDTNKKKKKKKKTSITHQCEKRSHSISLHAYCLYCHQNAL
jgi:hypothetical protein